MDYDKTNPESILHAKGRVCVVLHVDGLDREEKDVVRAAAADPYSDVAKLGKDYFALIINEEPEDDEPVGDFEEEQELDKDPTVVDEEDGDEPTLSDLESLTVAQLKDLADKEALDVSDLKLKADLVGRLAAHFGVQI